MAYPKRVYTDGIEEFTYEDANRIETGIETNDLAIAKINSDNIVRDKEISTKETITGAQDKADTALKSAKEYADGKVKLNGSTTNVNFIQSEIAQGGSKYENVAKTKHTTFKYLSGDLHVLCSFEVKQNSAATYHLFGNIRNAKGFVVNYKNTGAIVFEGRDLSGTTKEYWSTQVTDVKHRHMLEILISHNNAEIKIDGVSMLKVTNSEVIQNSINDSVFALGIYSNFIAEGIALDNYLLDNTVFYNRILTQQEINHNLIVLNNTSSISSIETTDSSSVKTSFLIGTDSVHVEMPNGRTLRDFAYETLDWETKISDGSDITVSNGKKAWVRNAKTSGNTVKNYALSFNTLNNFHRDSPTLATLDTALNRMKVTASTNYINAFLKKSNMLLPNTEYKIVLFIYENTLNGKFHITTASTDSCFYKTNSVSAGQTGIFEFKTITQADLSSCLYDLRSSVDIGSTTGYIVYNAIIIETNASSPTKYIPFGLTSTQAILTNNGVKYPFYKLLEDKTSGTVITLGGVGGVYDYITMNEDGSAILTQNTMKTTLGGTQTVIYNEGMSTGTIAYFSCTMNDECYAPTTVIADKFITKAWVNGDAVEAVFASSSSKKLIYCGVLKTKLTTIDSLGYKSYLQSNPVTIRYQLATPIVTHIPASLVPTIVTEQANTFSVDSAVKPSSIEVTVAVDKVSDLEKRLQVVEAVINTKSNLSLQANYAEDEYNNLINQI